MLIAGGPRTALAEEPIWQPLNDSSRVFVYGRTRAYWSCWNLGASAALPQIEVMRAGVWTIVAKGVRAQAPLPSDVTCGADHPTVIRYDWTVQDLGEATAAPRKRLVQIREVLPDYQTVVERAVNVQEVVEKRFRKTVHVPQCGGAPIRFTERRIRFDPPRAVRAVIKTIHVQVCRVGDVESRRERVVRAWVRVRVTTPRVVMEPGPVIPGVVGMASARTLYASEADYVADISDAIMCSFGDTAYCHP